MTTPTSITQPVRGCEIDAWLALDVIMTHTATMTRLSKLSAPVLRAYMDKIRNAMQTLEGCVAEMEMER